MSFNFTAEILSLFVDAISEKFSGKDTTLSPCDIHTSNVSLNPLKISVFFFTFNFAFPYSLDDDFFIFELNFLQINCIPKQIPSTGISFKNNWSGKSYSLFCDTEFGPPDNIIPITLLKFSKF